MELAREFYRIRGTIDVNTKRIKWKKETSEEKRRLGDRNGENWKGINNQNMLGIIKIQSKLSRR